jgi:hypothetical protein
MAKITDSELEELLYFALKESIEFAKTSDKDYTLATEKKLQKTYEEKYNFSAMLASRIQRPVTWHLSKHEYIPFDGCSKWHIAEKAKNLTEQDLKDMTKTILESNDTKCYLKSNFKLEGYDVQ